MIKFWSPQSFDKKTLSDWTIQSYEQILPYVEQFLCAKHPFRDGSICPFVPNALRADRIFFVEGFGKSIDDISRAEELIMESISLLEDRKARLGGFCSVIILFEHNFEVSRLLEIHRDNRMSCITRGLMIGALYPTSQAPSLHNALYFPLRTPVPTLVLRDMVPNDLIFVDPSVENPKNKLAFLKQFLTLFKSGGSENTEKLLAEARVLKKKYERIQLLTRASIGLLLFIALSMLFLLFVS